MRAFIHIVIILFTIVMNAQQAFHNFGNIQIHNEGEVGFHTDVVNDGTFNQNLGFTGFYSSDELTISGSSRPVFHDIAIDVVGNLFLEVSVGANNFMEFINGRVFTPRDQIEVSLDYINDAPYLGENDDRHVDGYASIIGDLDFSFPIGDDYRLRPMKIENQSAVNTARGAYFFENPNNPNSFSESFDTNNFEERLYGISIFEFWDLDGNVPTNVTLTWDDNSNIPTLVDNINNLRVVGWDKNSSRWVNLGNLGISGTIDDGEIKSNIIVPDNYTILTFGSSSSILDGDLQFYAAVSPNGDGANDFFRIDGLGNFPDNQISMYNRWGVLVYQRKNYHLIQDTDGFNGTSEGRVSIDADAELPVGTYFYVLTIEGAKDRSGYVYVNR